MNRSKILIINKNIMLNKIGARVVLTVVFLLVVFNFAKAQPYVKKDSKFSRNNNEINKTKVIKINEENLLEEAENDSVRPIEVYALLVGISNYDKIRRLNYATHDILHIESFLRRYYGDKILVDTLLNKNANDSQVKSYLFNILDKYSETKTIYIVFSGHGGAESSNPVNDDGFLYLYDAPVNASASGRGLVKMTTLQKIVKQSAENGTKVVIILDVCHAGKMVGDSSGVKQLVNYLGKDWSKNNIKILSCQADEQAIESNLYQKGLLSHFLVKGLEGGANLDNNGNIQAWEMKKYLSDSIPVIAKKLHHRQNPIVFGDSSTILIDSKQIKSGSEGNTNIINLTPSLYNNRKTQPSLERKSKPKGSALKIDNLTLLDTTSKNMLNKIENYLKNKYLDSAYNLLVVYGKQFSKKSALYKEQIFKLVELCYIISSDYNQQIHDYHLSNFTAPINVAKNFQFNLLNTYFSNSKSNSSTENLSTLLVNCLSIIDTNNAFYNELLFNKYILDSQLLISQNQTSSALNNLENSLSIYPNFGLPYLLIAKILYVTNKVEGALIHLEMYNRLVPNEIRTREIINVISDKNSDSTKYIVKGQMVEVPLDKKFVGATVLTFQPPYKIMTVFIDDDLDSRYSTITITPNTVFLKQNLGSRKQDKLKPEVSLFGSDVRPGMRIDLRADHYQRSLRNEAKEIVLAGEYYGNTKITGLFEFIDGDKASVDGQLVKLNKGTILKGINEWKEKSFESFNELQLGTELTLYGKRETDGITYVTRGIARPIEPTKEDWILRRSVGLALKVDKNQLSLGNEFTRNLIADNTMQDYINNIGRRIVPEYLRTLPVNHPDYIDFKFYIVNDQTLNASAFPNGAVVVHTGILKKIDNEAQLAAILGHEIAHVTQKHHIKNYRNRQNWEAVSNMLTVAASVNSSDNLPPAAIGIASEMYVSKYRREQETQADRIGLRYIYDAGYDAREAVKIWGKLSQEEAGAEIDVKANIMMLQMMSEDKSLIPVKVTDPERREPLYASHPRSRDRFNHVNFLLSTTYTDVDFSKAIINKDQYQKMLRSITYPILSTTSTAIGRSIPPSSKVKSKAPFKPKKKN